MTSLIRLAAVAAFVLATSTYSSAAVVSDSSVLKPAGVVYGQDECMEGETYNEDTKKCEKPEG